jgi:putative flippase GtrA
MPDLTPDRHIQHNSVVQFFAFVVVGAIAAIITLVSRYFINYVVAYEAAVAVSQMIGMIVAYSLNRLLVFETSGRMAIDEFARFSLVNIVSLGLVTGFSSLFYRLVLPWLSITFYPDVLAQLIGIATCTLPSYFGHKLYTFR